MFDTARVEYSLRVLRVKGDTYDNISATIHVLNHQNLLLLRFTYTLDHPSIKKTGREQVLNVLECLSGDVDAKAVDAKPDPKIAAHAMGMVIEDDTEGRAATTDGGMIGDHDIAAHNTGRLCAFHPTHTLS